MHVHVRRFELDKSSYQLFIVISLQIPHVYCPTLITNNKLTLRIYKDHFIVISFAYKHPTSNWFNAVLLYNCFKNGWFDQTS